jgi:hypothetical protein
MSLNDFEITRRAPVWEALAELFLDTELQDYHYRYIAERLRDSGYALHELEQILSEEIAPVFYTNLSAVAGEWQPWSADFVKERVLQYLNHRPTLAERLLPQRFLRERRLARVRERWEGVRRLIPE